MLLSKGRNMVAVTYDHLNGCKCHNRACSCTGNGFCSSSSKPGLDGGNAMDTADLTLAALHSAPTAACLCRADVC